MSSPARREGAFSEGLCSTAASEAPEGSLLGSWTRLPTPGGRPGAGGLVSPETSLTANKAWQREGRGVGWPRDQWREWGAEPVVLLLLLFGPCSPAGSPRHRTRCAQRRCRERQGAAPGPISGEPSSPGTRHGHQVTANAGQFLGIIFQELLSQSEHPQLLPTETSKRLLYLNRFAVRFF